MRLLEHLFVVGRLGRFQQEYLYQRPRAFAEMQTGLNDLRIVHHHQRTFGQIVGQVVEHILPHYTFII